MISLLTNVFFGLVLVILVLICIGVIGAFFVGCHNLAMEYRLHNAKRTAEIAKLRKKGEDDQP